MQSPQEIGQSTVVLKPSSDRIHSINGVLLVLVLGGVGASSLDVLERAQQRAIGGNAPRDGLPSNDGPPQYRGLLPSVSPLQFAGRSQNSGPSILVLFQIVVLKIVVLLQVMGQLPQIVPLPVVVLLPKISEDVNFS